MYRYAASVMNSPWAKFTTPDVRKIMTMPMATKPVRAPLAMPEATMVHTRDPFRDGLPAADRGRTRSRDRDEDSTLDDYRGHGFVSGVVGLAERNRVADRDRIGEVRYAEHEPFHALQCRDDRGCSQRSLRQRCLDRFSQHERRLVALKRELAGHAGWRARERLGELGLPRCHRACGGIDQLCSLRLE